MTTANLPPDDHTVPPGPGPDVQAPSPTVLWRVRTVAEDIDRLLKQIGTHPRPRRQVTQRATQIKAQVHELTAGGRSVAVDAIDALDEARTQLQELLQVLTGTVTTPTMVAEPAGQGDVAAASASTTPAPGPAPWPLPHLIRAERQHLPITTSALPWRDRKARRRVRAWSRAWSLTLASPVDRDAVEEAWAGYLAATNTSSSTQIAPSPTTPEGT